MWQGWLWVPPGLPLCRGFCLEKRLVFHFVALVADHFIAVSFVFIYEAWIFMRCIYGIVFLRRSFFKKFPFCSHPVVCFFFLDFLFCSAPLFYNYKMDRPRGPMTTSVLLIKWFAAHYRMDFWQFHFIPASTITKSGSLVQDTSVARIAQNSNGDRGCLDEIRARYLQ